jgi:citrate synthase
VAAELAKITPSEFRYLLTQSIVLLAQAWSREPRLRHRPCSAHSILRVMAGTFGFLGPGAKYVPLKTDESIAHGLARALGIKTSAENVRALNVALVLMADHELTTPTFVARISASAGCDLQSCILAALQVHFGSEFGLCCDRLEPLFDSRSPTIRSRALMRLRAQRSTPGFDNPLYSGGDPRANFILDLALSLVGKSECASQTLQAIVAHFPTVQTRINLCEALVVLCRALGLPHQAAGGLVALSRSAGCVAHILEQRAQNLIIRPRGKFVPASSASR